MSIEERWIPTTTCMWPKKYGEYLITVKDKYTESGYSVEAVTFDPNYDGKPRWYRECMNEFYEFDMEYFLPKDVTAWMPYPKAYNKGGN